MKLGRFAILMIGITVFVVAVSWGFIINYIPNMKEAGMLEDNKKLNDEQAAMITTAKKRKEQAIKMVDAKAAIWRRIVETRTPPMDLAAGGIDLSVNPWQLSVDVPKYRNNIQRAVNAQVKKGGIKVIQGPTVTGIDPNLPVEQILPTFFNYPALKFPVVLFDFGTITVQGTYKQILDNVRSYKDMPHYLAVTDGLRIDGTSPILTGTYNLTVVGFIKTKTIAPAVPEGASSGSTTGAGGPPPGFGAPGQGRGRTGGGGPGSVGAPPGAMRA